MTPLAKRIVRELTIKPSRRTFRDECGLLERMDDIHCFEVSDVYALAADMLRRGDVVQSEPSALDRAFEETSFLPAPKTWIEWSNVPGVRTGILLVELKEYANFLLRRERATAARRLSRPMR